MEYWIELRERNCDISTYKEDFMSTIMNNTIDLSVIRYPICYWYVVIIWTIKSALCLKAGYVRTHQNSMEVLNSFVSQKNGENAVNTIVYQGAILKEMEVHQHADIISNKWI